ncbi:MAG: hypothetical protein WAQ52_05090 [Terriglobales bacterium]
MKVPLVLVVLVVVSCGSSFSQESLPYFPPRTFYGDFATLDAGVIRWYSACLSMLREPSLWAASKDSRRQTYRFLWLRTWDQPISIRIDRNADGSGTLTLKVATSSVGCEANKLQTSRTKNLTKEEFASVVDQFTTSGFWTAAPTEHSSGKDGADWVLEGAMDGQFHAVKRWSPQKGSVRQLALLILRLSDFRVAEDRVY